jgi:hypothetical protein
MVTSLERRRWGVWVGYLLKWGERQREQKIEEEKGRVRVWGVEFMAA